jgi:hypothetical protein
MTPSYKWADLKNVRLTFISGDRLAIKRVVRCGGEFKFLLPIGCILTSFPTENRWRSWSCRLLGRKCSSPFGHPASIGIQNMTSSQLVGRSPGSCLEWCPGICLGLGVPIRRSLVAARLVIPRGLSYIVLSLWPIPQDGWLNSLHSRTFYCAPPLLNLNGRQKMRPGVALVSWIWIQYSIIHRSTT